LSRPTAAAKGRPRRNDQQREALLDAACRLFIERGFGGTNINDIADAVGVTRTALYYYFPSKESMLQALTEEVTEQAARMAGDLARSGAELAPDEALRRLVEQHASLILRHPLQFRVVERSESSLPEPHRSQAAASRRAVLDNFVEAIERGIHAGVFRRVNAHVSAFAILGMCNWCAWWFDPDGDVPADGVAQTIVDFSLRSLMASTPRRARADSAAEALEQMRDALGVLEAKVRSR
jgi:AcrR family transcriptional regulator